MESAAAHHFSCLMAFQNRRIFNLPLRFKIKCRNFEVFFSLVETTRSLNIWGYSTAKTINLDTKKWSTFDNNSFIAQFSTFHTILWTTTLKPHKTRANKIYSTTSFQFFWLDWIGYCAHILLECDFILKLCRISAIVDRHFYNINSDDCGSSKRH